MNYLDLNLLQLHQLLIKKEIKPSDLFALSLKRAHKLQGKLNPFVTILNDNQQLADQLDNTEPNNPLFGIPYVAKDNFSTKGILTTGSSQILSDYYPLFNCDVIERLTEKKAILLGKTVLDELAMGGTGTNCCTGPSLNPWDDQRISGGSSGGSAVAVAAGIVPFALGSDTGDSVRKPAAYCGIVGFKPTWGRISRYGVFPFAPSLDHVAYFTRSVLDSAYLLTSLSGASDNDRTTSLLPVEDYVKLIDKVSLLGAKIGYIKEIIEAIENKEVVKNFHDTIDKLRQKGAIVLELNFDYKLLRAIYPVYNIISCSEATSNNANLDGIKFGLRESGNNAEDVTINTRTAGFSKQVKSRFIVGAFCLSSENQEALFLKAQKARHMIVDRYNELLEQCEFILSPASGNIAPNIKEKNNKLTDNYIIAENHLALANFNGAPSITIPSGFLNDMPLGINVTSKVFNEASLLSFAALLEELIGLKNLVAKEGR